MSNILPLRQKISIRHLYRKRFLAVILITVACLALIGSILLVPAFLISKNTESSFKSQRDILASHETSTIVNSLASSISDINRRLAVFPVSVPMSPLVADLIDPVLRAKSNTVHITGFSFLTDTSGTKIQISGITDNREALLTFGDKLKAIDGFSNVDVPITSFIKGSNVVFTISASLLVK